MRQLQLFISGSNVFTAGSDSPTGCYLPLPLHSHASSSMRLFVWHHGAVNVILTINLQSEMWKCKFPMWKLSFTCEREKANNLLKCPTHVWHYFLFTCEYIEFTLWEGNFSNSLTFPLFNHHLLHSELSRPSPFSLSLDSRKAKNNLEKGKKKKKKPHSPAVKSVKPNQPSENVCNQDCDTLSLKHLSILLRNWKELYAQRERGRRRRRRREGISELWETIGLAFSFYNGAEPNKET